MPIHPELRPALEEARKGATSPYVIESGGKRVESIKKSFHRAAAKAGMPEVTPHEELRYEDHEAAPSTCEEDQEGLRVGGRARRPAG